MTELKPQWAKVPALTLGFWVIKIAATTLGETAGDAVTMSLGLGYLVGTSLFAALFLVAVAAQVRARRFHPWLFWLVIVATTTVGTTLADFCDRSLGIGYPGGSALLAALLGASLLAWRIDLGTVSVNRLDSRRAEMYYWATILFSQTLGTALGDWVADDDGWGLGYGGGALLFGAALAVVVALYALMRRAGPGWRTGLFWAAFILTRPLGATAGDGLVEVVADGGLALSRFGASGVLIVLIAACILLLPQRPERLAAPGLPEGGH